MKIYQLTITENNKLKKKQNITIKINNIKNENLIGTIIRRGIIKNNNKENSLIKKS